MADRHPDAYSTMTAEIPSRVVRSLGVALRNVKFGGSVRKGVRHNDAVTLTDARGVEDDKPTQ